MLRYLTVCLALILSTLGGAQAADKVASREITIYAAASLQDALTEIAKNYETMTMQHIRVKFDGSNVLAKEIAAGAPANLFISADEDWMKFLGQHNQTIKGTRTTHLSNALVVIANAKATWTLTDLTQMGAIPFKSLSMADPSDVPAGKYARIYLSTIAQGKSTVWDAVKGRVKPAANVRKALHAVETDKTALGLVYRTDAMSSKGVKILYEIPATATPIYYALAMVKNKAHGQPVLDVYNYLQSRAAKDVYVKYGFGTPRPSEGRGRPGPARKSPKPGASDSPTPKPGSKKINH